MMELPEVLTLSRQADQALKGKKIARVYNATRPHRFTFWNGDPLQYERLLAGRTIVGARGVGMYVDFLLDDGTIINIGDGVIVRYHEAGAKIPANYQLLIGFEDESFLVFSVAMYGFIGVYAEGVIDNEYYRTSSRSISPLSDHYTFEHFEKLFAEAPKALTAKGILATKQRIPGVGNGVTQDILFNARINPKQKVLALPDKQRKALFDALKSTLAEMVAKGGRDVQTDLYGIPGGYRTILSANTWKKPCPRCGGMILKEAYLGGSIYYCPTCQPII